MPTRDQDCCPPGTCRQEMMDVLFSGRFPSERHVELLLDRLERDADREDVPAPDARR